MSTLYLRKELSDGETLITDLHPGLRRKHRSPSENEMTIRTKADSNSRIGRDCVISTEHIDSDGDIMRAAGCDMSEYKANPIVYLQHGIAGGFPVIGGNAIIESFVGSDGVPGLIAKEWLFGSSDVAKAVNADWNDLILRTASVGFLPIEFLPIDSDGNRVDPRDPRSMEKQTGFEFVRWKLREWSIVAIPANQNARRMLSEVASPEHAKAMRFYDLGALRKACTRCAGGEKHEKRGAAPTVKAGGFDPSTEPLEAGSTVVAWAAKFLGVNVSQVMMVADDIPRVRLGSFLQSLKDVESARNLTESARRNIGYSVEFVPRHETVQLTSTKSGTFLVDGTTFLSHGSSPRAVIVRKYYEYSGSIDVQIYHRSETPDEGREILSSAWALARGANNFLRGEAFSLSGEFLPKTGDTWGNVFLESRNLTAIKRAVDKLNDRGKDAVSRGILMAGPPGTGKTLSGRVMRNEANATFIWVAARDFWSSGGGFGTITRSLDMARELAPSIVFLEDVDNWLDGYTIDLLKSELDGVQRRAGVMTVLTTNFPDQLPEALIDRPGRFHDVLKFDLPSEAERVRMLDAWLPGLGSAEASAAVEATAGYSGAHLFELAAFAKTLAEDDGLILSQALDSALATLREQRELIDSRQLAGSRYRPSKAEAAVIKTKGDSAARRALELKEPSVMAEPEIVPTALFPEPTRIIAGKLKAVSLERCPECRDVVLYSRDSGELFYHRTRSGPECRAKALGFAPTGPTLRDLADAVREETAVGSPVPLGLAGEAGAAVSAILVAADAIGASKAMAGIQERIKAGRTLSAESRRVVVGAAIQAEDAAKAIVEAAAALRAYLAASDGTDETEPEEPFPTVTDASLAAALAEITG